MRVIIVYITCILSLSCKAQRPIFMMADNASRTDSLYAEILSNLAHRKDNIQKNGTTIAVPRFSDKGLKYLSTFINEGGLREIPDSAEWSFIRTVSDSYNISNTSFNKYAVKRILATRNIELSEKSGLKTGFGPIIFNKENNRVCVIYYDFFSNSPGTGVITNRIIAFYSYKKGQWNKEATLPLSLE